MRNKLYIHAMKYLKLLKFIISILPKIKNINFFFFFPSYHMGGAETVHGDILKVFKNEQTVCFITGFSANNYNLKNFQSNSLLFDIYNTVKRSKLKKKIIRLISKQINNSKKPIVFGCNSMFFYDLIPYLEDHVKIIDLIHAFSYEEPNASEKYSLKVTERINSRIVLGEKTKNDFKQLYAENNLSESLMNRIQIIKNKVDIPEYKCEKTNKKITILFVGRDSYEKRPWLFFEIAKRTLDLPVEYLVLGDSFKEYQATENLKVIGSIKEREILDAYYKKAHLLLITSSREGMPMVILEGMAYGVVPIATDVGEINSFINPKNENGRLINSTQSEEEIINDFIFEIKNFIDSPKLLELYSSNAYISLKEEFSEKIFSESYKLIILNK
ncbi:glycosyltransferase family 4 protein [Flavobacterium oreochromis]|uniref:glycosyltransferase family 4 protein n=1 Tax=Flavobacterium oreochromis TaxID=2906078 RepID=UPI00385A15DE